MAFGLTFSSSGFFASELLITSQVRFVDGLANRYKLSDATVQKINSLKTPLAPPASKPAEYSDSPNAQIALIDSALKGMTKIEGVVRKAYDSSKQALKEDDPVVLESLRNELKGYQTDFDNILVELERVKSRLGIAPAQQKTYSLVVESTHSAAKALGQFEQATQQASLDSGHQAYETHLDKSRKTLSQLSKVLSGFSENFRALSSFQTNDRSRPHILDTLGKKTMAALYPDPAYQGNLETSATRFRQLNGNLIDLTS